MPLDLVTPKGEADFSINYPGMEMALSIMGQQGIDLKKKRERGVGEMEAGPLDERAKASLYETMGENSGYQVLPDEALTIAEALEGFKGRKARIGHTWVMKSLRKSLRADPESKVVHLSEDDLEFMREFAGFCREASKHGGFYVF